ncbi:uncharacterized protein LOC108632659 [Ceratina calcarata]|uniref:Uncharacterized protein LOC108631266 n=1 Tax=Ceratina calcarata TaxID=156304 RepID=A0AAJ7JHF5_9HYME|nr:uncharacterized protein LOC108631266 [Ceratina calcarata]XP_017892844.1 uncharacterized protein LOC108632659 [Ceratina calcarata]
MSHAAHLLLVQRCDETKTDIGIISEPRRNPGKNWISDPSGLAAIFVNNNDLASSFQVISSFDGFVLVGNQHLRIGGCYFSPNGTPLAFERYLKKINKTLRKENYRTPIIIGGDFNAHNKKWGSKKNNAKGKTLERWAGTNRLFLINRGNAPTCIRQHGSSIVDITWANEEARKRIYDWQVQEGVETLSDHAYISMSVRYDKSAPGNMKNTSSQYFPRWNVKKFDSDLCKALLLIETWNPKRANQINLKEEINKLEDALTRACNLSMPKKKMLSTKPPNDWWNDELSTLRQDCQRKRRTWQKSRKKQNQNTDESQMKYEHYKEAKLHLIKAIMAAKRQTWKRLLETLDNDPWGKPYKWTKKMRDNCSTRAYSCSGSVSADEFIF